MADSPTQWRSRCQYGAQVWGIDQHDVLTPTPTPTPALTPAPTRPHPDPTLTLTLNLTRAICQL
jgi:hypothetical protein